MKADRLLALYEKVAEAPDAIARLRRFVLDLAVRGKLIEQDPADEPASELLKRIAAEKARLMTAGEIRKPKPTEPIQPDDVPFELPRSWRWVRLSDILTKLTDGTHHSPPNGPEGDFLYITAKNIKDDGVKLDDVSYVSSKVHEEIYARCNPEPGDILYIKDGATTGIVTVNDLKEPFSMLSSVALLKLPPCIYNQLIVRFLRSPFFYEQMRSFMKGAAITRVTLKRMGPALLPLPPLAEQRRIVAKVEELMALLDRLEAARTAREATRDRLTAASLARLTAPETDQSGFEENARFTLDVLPALTTRPDQIKPLRQTILNLAVRGKLVAQDPTDEPASELLTRIHGNRIHKRKFAQLNSEELEIEPPSLPSGWLWTVVDQTAADDSRAITDGPFGSQLKTAHYIERPGFRVIRLQNIAAGQFRDEHRSYINESRFKELANHHVVPGNLVVAGLVDPNVRCCEVPDNIGPALVKADCYRFAVHPDLDHRFALHYLNSPLAQEFALTHHHGMTLTRIGLGNFRKLPFPLPPLAEQHRIVAKVDALMALCDRLEAALTTADTTSTRLLEALLHEALEPANDAMEAAE
ncbi:MAG: type I restriction endonuclease subunit S [Alphaproteobacteria bacterium]|nr:type I restriction endonuclease subunit S [Alphaproteobacteria bacterium]